MNRFCLLICHRCCIRTVDYLDRSSCPGYWYVHLTKNTFHEQEIKEKEKTVKKNIIKPSSYIFMDLLIHNTQALFMLFKHKYWEMQVVSDYM